MARCNVKRGRKARLCPGLRGLHHAMVLILILVGGCYTSESHFEKTRCCDNLRSLGHATLAMYSPEEVALLAQSDDPWNEAIARAKSSAAIPNASDFAAHVWGCPSRKSADKTPYMLNPLLHRVLGRMPPSRLPIIWDRPGNHEAYVCVYYLDGHVSAIPHGEFENLLLDIIAADRGAGEQCQGNSGMG